MFVSRAVVVSLKTFCQNVVLKPILSLFNYICSFLKEPSILLPTISFVPPLAVTLLAFYPWIEQQEICNYITILPNSTCNTSQALNVTSAIFFTILTSIFQKIVLKQSSIAYKHFFSNFTLTQDQSILFESSIIHIFTNENNIKKWSMISNFIYVVVIVIDTFFHQFLSNSESFILYFIFGYIQIFCIGGLLIKFCFFGEIMTACKLHEVLSDTKFEEWLNSFNLDLTQTQTQIKIIDNMRKNPPYFISIPIELCQQCFHLIMNLEFVKYSTNDHHIGNYIENKFKSFLYLIFVKSNKLTYIQRFFAKIDNFVFMFVDFISELWINAVKSDAKLEMILHFVCIYLSFWICGVFINLILGNYNYGLKNLSIFLHCKCIAVGHLFWTLMLVNYYVEGYMMFIVYEMFIYGCLLSTFAVATIFLDLTVDNTQFSDVFCLGFILLEICICLLSKYLLTGLLRVGSDIDKLKYLHDVFVKKEDKDKTIQWLIKDVIINKFFGLYKLKSILIEQCLMEYLNYNENVVDIIVWKYLFIVDDCMDYDCYK